MAARVAEELKAENGVEVETVKGGLGEFSVHLGGRKIVETSRLWYPTPRKVVEKVRAHLTD